MPLSARRAPAPIAAFLSLAALSGCFSSEEETRPRPDRLVVYSSTPQSGPAAAVGRSFVDGARSALEAHDGTGGEFEVELRSLDSAAGDRRTTPDATDSNAREAAADPSAIAYLGELDPATAPVSLPILNEAGLAQVGPASLPSGLTRAGPYARAGDPERHYPTGERHFVRIVPAGEREAEGVAELMSAAGCSEAFLMVAPGGDAAARLRQLAAAVGSAGPAVAGQAELPAEPDDARELAQEVAASGARCLGVVTASIDTLAPDSLSAVIDAAGPRARVYADERLVRPGASGDLPAHTLAVTGATRGPRREAADPWALYGYEAMSLALDAVARAGPRGNDRAAVIDRLFATRDRRGVLGTYSIDRQGDTTLRRLGVWSVGSGNPVFVRALRPGASGQ